MAVGNATGFHQDSSGSDFATVLLGTVPAGGYLVSADVQGYINYVYQAFTIATGGFSGYNLAAGLQYGAAGYGGFPILNGAATGASWVAFGSLVPPQLANQDLPGASPQTAMQATGFPLDLHWRGSLFFPAAADIYIEVGCNTGLSPVPNFRTSFTWDIIWATFP